MQTSIDTRLDAERLVESGVARIYQAAKARIKSLAVRFHPDLQPVGYGLLRYVFDGEPVRSGDIAVALGMDKSAVSRQVASLREMGLIDTRPDPADGRAFLLVATTSARASLEVFRTESANEFAQVFEGWSTKEICELGRLLEKFNESIV